MDIKKFFKSNLFTNKSKFKIAIPIILSLILIIGLIIPFNTHAAILTGAGIAKAIFSLLIKILIAIASFLANTSVGFMESMLEIGFQKNQDIAKIGWTATRNFANMLFILFMVIIAFATILRIENYGIKKLLPKIIAVALLINFSMVFCYVFIDFSNVIAGSFVKDVEQIVGGKGKIAPLLRESLKIEQHIVYTECAGGRDMAIEECKNIYSNDNEKLEKCKKYVEDQFTECNKIISKFVDPSEGLVNIFVTGVFTIILLLISAFTMFATGILLVIRVIYLWILVIIAPLAVICLILPSLRSSWKKWWSKFLNWCLFAPIFSFFLWLAIKMANDRKLSNLANDVSPEAMSLRVSAFGPDTVNPFANSLETTINFAIIIGLMLGGLLTAKSLDLTGADALIKLGNKWKKGATDWAKRKFITRPGQLVGGAAQRFGGATLKKIPGLKTYGAKMEAKGKLLQQKMLKDKDIERDKQLFEQMSPSDLSRAMKDPLMNLTPAQKLALAQVAASDKFKNKIDADATTYAAETLQNFDLNKEANDLRDARLDGLDDIAAEKRVNKLKTSGELGNISAKALESPRIVKLLTRICNAEELEVIRSKSKKQENALKISLTSLATDSSNITNKEIQYAYAAQTGDTSKLGGLSSTEREEFTGKYANSSQLRRIKIDMTSPLSGTSQAEIMSGIPKNGFRTMIEGMDKGSASYVIRFIKVNRSASPKLRELFNVINGDPYLNSLG